LSQDDEYCIQEQINALFFSAEEGQTHRDSFSAIIECKKEKMLSTSMINTSSLSYDDLETS
jgi:hypothetical protein